MNRAGGRAAGAAAAVALLCGAGRRPVRIPASPRMPVGTVYEVHRTEDGVEKVAVDRAGKRKSKVLKDHFVETLRCKVLAVDRHGAPTKLQVTYVDVQAQGDTHPMASRASARTFVVSVGKHPDDLPLVTEDDVKVNDQLARLVHNDTLGVISPRQLVVVTRKALAHPGRRIRMPVRLLTRIGGPSQVRFESASVELRRVVKGVAHTRSWLRYRFLTGFVPGDVRASGTGTIDARGRPLTSIEHSVISGRRTVMTPKGRVTLSETGHETDTAVYDYDVKTKKGGK